MKYKVTYRVHLSDSQHEDCVAVVDVPTAGEIWGKLKRINGPDFTILRVTPLNVLTLMEGKHTIFNMARLSSGQISLARVNSKIEPLYLYEVTIGVFRTYVLSPTVGGAVDQAKCHPAVTDFPPDVECEAVRLAFMIHGWSGRTF